MLKITGVILCVLGCTGYGALKISGWKKALEEFEQWILLFEKMKSHIYYQRDVITDVCCRMEQNIYGLGGRYVAKVGADLQKDRTRGFFDVWSEHMERWDKQSYLPKEIRLLIHDFPDYIGEQNYEQQISYLDFYLERLRNEKKVFEKQVRENQKPVMAISLVSGMAIAILLI